MVEAFVIVTCVLALVVALIGIMTNRVDQMIGSFLLIVFIPLWVALLKFSLGLFFVVGFFYTLAGAGLTIGLLARKFLKGGRVTVGNVLVELPTVFMWPATIGTRIFRRVNFPTTKIREFLDRELVVRRGE